MSSTSFSTSQVSTTTKKRKKYYHKTFKDPGKQQKPLAVIVAEYEDEVKKLRDEVSRQKSLCDQEVQEKETWKAKTVDLELKYQESVASTGNMASHKRSEETAGDETGTISFVPQAR